MLLWWGPYRGQPHMMFNPLLKSLLLHKGGRRGCRRGGACCGIRRRSATSMGCCYGWESNWSTDWFPGKNAAGNHHNGRRSYFFFFFSCKPMVNLMGTNGEFHGWFDGEVDANWGELMVSLMRERESGKLMISWWLMMGRFNWWSINGELVLKLCLFIW